LLCYPLKNMETTTSTQICNLPHPAYNKEMHSTKRITIESTSNKAKISIAHIKGYQGDYELKSIGISVTETSIEITKLTSKSSYVWKIERNNSGWFMKLNGKNKSLRRGFNDMIAKCSIIDEAGDSKVSVSALLTYLIDVLKCKIQSYSIHEMNFFSYSNFCEDNCTCTYDGLKDDIVKVDNHSNCPSPEVTPPSMEDHSVVTPNMITVHDTLEKLNCTDGMNSLSALSGVDIKALMEQVKTCSFNIYALVRRGLIGYSPFVVLLRDDVPIMFIYDGVEYLIGSEVITIRGKETKLINAIDSTCFRTSERITEIAYRLDYSVNHAKPAIYMEERLSLLSTVINIMLKHSFVETVAKSIENLNVFKVCDATLTFGEGRHEIISVETDTWSYTAANFQLKVFETGDILKLTDDDIDAAIICHHKLVNKDVLLENSVGDLVYLLDCIVSDSS
jgi:hypothetical protein